MLAASEHEAPPTPERVPLSRRIYPRPPIVEAIIDFRYVAEVSQAKILEALRASIGEKYKGEPKKQERIEFSARVEGESVTSSTQRMPHLTFLRTSDDLRLIGVAAGIISVHVLAPYPGWERFLEQTQEAIQALPREVRDGTITTLAIRYINRITLPSGSVGEYLTVLPPRPTGMPVQLSAFHVVTEAEDDVDGTTVLLTVASAPSRQENTNVLIYDLNIQRTGNPVCSFSNEAWCPIVEALHRRQRDIFEASITEKMREHFQ